MAALCWGGFGAPVLAAEFAYGAGYSLTYDSNIARVPNNALNEWTQSLIGGLAFQERSVDLNARVSAEVEWRDYIFNRYSDGEAYFVNGAAVWTILPQQFSWTVEDVSRQVLVDVTAPDTPANRANSNALSTGPDFTFRLNPTNSAAIGARYGRFDIAGPGDNVRYSAYARLLRRVSEPTTVSLNYEPSRVYFDEPALYTKVSREDLFVRYDTRFALNSVTIDLGASRITRDGAEDLSGPLARLLVAYQLTSSSALRASLAEEYSETSSDLLKGVTSTTAPTDAARRGTTDAVTNDIYYSKSGDLTYTNQDGIFGYNLRGYARRVDYQQLLQDYDERGGRFGFTWFVSGETQIRVHTEYLKRIFRDFDQTDTESTASVGVTYRLTRNVNVSLDGARIERASTAPTNNFVDWRAVLLLGYSTGPLYAVQSRQ